jgi:hypothetical protein
MGFKESTKCNFFGCNCRLRDAKGGFVRMPRIYAQNKVDGEWALSDSAVNYPLVVPDGKNCDVFVEAQHRKASLEAAHEVGGRSAEDARAMVAHTDRDQGMCACHFDASHVHVDGVPGPKDTPMFNLKALSQTALALPRRLQPPLSSSSTSTSARQLPSMRLAAAGGKKRRFGLVEDKNIEAQTCTFNFGATKRRGIPLGELRPVDESAQIRNICVT